MALLLTILVTYFPNTRAAETAAPTDIRPKEVWDILGPTAWDNQDEACRELRPGESRGVDEPARFNPDIIARKFRVTRDAEQAKLYHVEVPVMIDGNESALNQIFGSLLTPEQLRNGLGGDLIAKYITMANYCYEQQAGILKDPDGNQIKLKLVHKAKDPKTKPMNLTIDGESERANSKEWSLNPVCGTIIHETLHLLGLTDNYEEKWLTREYYDGIWPFGQTRTATLFNCRPKYPPSLMNDHWVLVPPLYQVVICKANGPPQTQYPSELDDFEGGKPQCPSNYKHSGEYPQITTGAIASVMSKSNQPGTLFLRKPIPDPTSTLLRSQVKFITNPHCTRDNDYLACSQNDKRTKELNGCVTLPESCKGPR